MEEKTKLSDLSFTELKDAKQFFLEIIERFPPTFRQSHTEEVANCKKALNIAIDNINQAALDRVKRLV